MSDTPRQAQDDLASQMRRVRQLANEHGQYDAADWISAHFPWPKSEEWRRWLREAAERGFGPPGVGNRR